jgi:hypothetical protein
LLSLFFLGPVLHLGVLPDRLCLVLHLGILPDRLCLVLHLGVLPDRLCLVLLLLPVLLSVLVPFLLRLVRFPPRCWGLSFAAPPLPNHAATATNPNTSTSTSTSTRTTSTSTTISTNASTCTGPLEGLNILFCIVQIVELLRCKA